MLFLCQLFTPTRKEVFRFENFWVCVPGFMEVAKDAWSCSVPGISPLNILCYKLQHTVKALQVWSKGLIANARLELQMVNDVIKLLDEALDRKQLSQDEFQL
jgi:hypothetical protein